MTGSVVCETERSGVSDLYSALRAAAEGPLRLLVSENTETFIFPSV